MKPKRFFFLFLFLVGSCSIFYSPRPVTAVDADITQSLIASNLQFGVTLPGADADVHADIGGKNAIQFTKLPSLQEGDQTVFRGRLKLQVDANFYTTYSATETFPNGKYIERSIRWLDLYTSPEPNLMLTTWAYTGCTAKYNEYDPTGAATTSLIPYSASFYSNFQYNAQHFGPTFPTFDYPSIDTNIIGSSDRASGFSGEALLAVDFVDLIPNVIDLYGDQVVLTTNSFDATVIETNLIQATSQAIGEYDVHFVGNNEAEITAYDVTQPTPSIGGDAAAQTLLVGATANLGVKRTKGIDDMSVYPYYKAQQGEKTCPTGIKSGSFRLELKPDVMIYREDLQVNYQLLVIDNVAGLFSPVEIELWYSSGVMQKTIQRIAGFKTTNFLIQTKWEVLVDIYAATQIDYDETFDSSSLNLPLFELEDMYFDTLLYGDTGYSLPYDPTSPIEDFLTTLWQDYWWILVIAGAAVLIYLFFVMGGPMLLQQAAMQRSIRMMRKTVGGHPRD